ncbi:hypothetical protein HMN09_01331400 [Mycena chlorophos]|uniref:Uncharacterized protein n=1 Tax=Mycena chlorophos TaxID=658473 RepID=A0A8H6RXP4_MYCCL|nr:hypothetical protein HMN09_01331400 [Mycena chlorophos]
MHLHNVSLPFAELLGLTLGALAYGVYLVLFVISMYLFLHQRDRDAAASTRGIGAPRPSLSRRVGGAARIPIILASFLLFSTTTTAYSISVYRSFRGLLFFQGGPDAYFLGVIDASATAQTTFFALSVVIGDFMILYRLWAVWRTLYIIIPPALSVIGLFVSFIMYSGGAGKFTVSTLNTLITIGTIFILVTNIYCTVGIAYRIITTAKLSKGIVRLSGERSTMYFLAIFVESAAIYTVWTIFFTILHLLNLNLQEAILFTVPSVLGSANALINSRIALGRAVDDARDLPGGMGVGEFSVGSASGSHGETTRNLSIRFADADADADDGGACAPDVEVGFGYGMEERGGSKVEAI